MLENTFQHIDGVGESSERRLWGMGCKSWGDILECDYGMPQSRYRVLKAGVLESMARLKDLDHRYFSCSLGAKLSWRAYRSFAEHACFLDIETTGLSFRTDKVTTVCLHSPGKGYTRNYVRGDNLQNLKNDLTQHRYVVTFNGARFDLPFLENSLGIRFDQIHLDLMYPLRVLGHRGGLKNIEAELGISRGSEGVTGYDAVRLWRSYQSNRQVEVAGRKVKGEDALKMLTEYNREDTVNLEALTKYAVKKLIDRELSNS